MKYQVTFTIDGPTFFDAVMKVGQEASGQRLLETFLQASTGSLTIRDAIALACYGLATGEVSAATSEGEKK